MSENLVKIVATYKVETSIWLTSIVGGKIYFIQRGQRVNKSYEFYVLGKNICNSLSL